MKIKDRMWQGTGYFLLLPLCIGFVLAYVGAFETADRLSGYEPITYWLPGVWTAWLTIYLGNLAAICFLRPWRPPLFIALLLGSGIASVAVSLEFYWYEAAWFPELLADALHSTNATTPVDANLADILAVYYPMTLPLVLVIALPVNMIAFTTPPFRWILRSACSPAHGEDEISGVTEPDVSGEAEAAGNTTGPKIPLLARLPEVLGKDIVCLEAQQHYLKVYTRVGSELIHYRLSDAVEELKVIGGGMRVHRSYWVNDSALTRVERRKGQLWLHLTNGLRIPVSRTYQLAVKEAGWLDRPVPGVANNSASLV